MSTKVCHNNKTRFWTVFALALTMVLGVGTFTPVQAAATGPGGFSLFSFLPKYIGVGGSFIRQDIGGELDFEDTGALNVKLGFEFVKFFNFEVTFDYFPEFEGDGVLDNGNTRDEEKQNVVNLSFVAKLPLALSFPILKPSLIFGMGIFNSTSDIKERAGGTSFSDDHSDTGLSLKFGAAIDFFIFESLQFGTEAVFVQFFGESNKSDDDVKFFMFTLYVAYRF